MSRTQNVRPRHLAVAGLLAGVAGLALYAVGWWIVDWEPRSDWGRLADPAWWFGGLVRGLSFLAFTKAGLKAAIVLVAAVIGGVSWVRSRRKARGVEQEVLPPESAPPESAPQDPVPQAPDATEWPRPPRAAQPGSA